MTLYVLLSLTLAAAPIASEKVEPAVPPTPPAFLVGLKVGGLFPQVLNRLSTTYAVALEVGWLLPFLNRQLALVVEGAYSQPARTLTVEDPRVPGSSYDFTVTEHTFGIYAGPKVFFLPLRGTFIPWVSVGVRTQFVDSELVGAAGTDFGLHHETGTHVAFGGQVGLGYHLGPGFVGLELQMITAPLDHLITGPVDIGDLAVRAGYHFAF